MALEMVSLSLKRCSYMQQAFVELLLSRVIWLSLKEIGDQIFQCTHSFSPIHIPMRRTPLFFYYTVASSSLTHLQCFSGAFSPLPVASVTSYMLITSQTVLPDLNSFPRFLTSCPLGSPLPACPTRYFKLSLQRKIFFLPSPDFFPLGLLS